MKDFDCKQCAVGARQSKALTGFFSRLSRRGKERTEPATVQSKRMDMARFPTPGSTWNYLVTFRLADGSQVEVLTMEENFNALQEGMTGILTWEGDNFLGFEEKED